MHIHVQPFFSESCFGAREIGWGFLFCLYLETSPERLYIWVPYSIWGLKEPAFSQNILELLQVSWDSRRVRQPEYFICPADWNPSMACFLSFFFSLYSLSFLPSLFFFFVSIFFLPPSPNLFFPIIFSSLLCICKPLEVLGGPETDRPEQAKFFSCSTLNVNAYQQ